MNISGLSNSSKQMIESRIGYRDDTIFGSGVTNFEDIIKYEINELCNDDILDTMMNTYDVFIDSCESVEFNISVVINKVKELLKYPDLTYDVTDTSYRIYNNGMIAIEQDKNMFIPFIDPKDTSLSRSAELHIKQLESDDNIYAIWLCPDEEQVQLVYNGWTISKYKINYDAIIVSDLGEDGALFCSRFPFNKIN
jgi:hypothetical protein